VYEKQGIKTGLEIQEFMKTGARQRGGNVGDPSQTMRVKTHGKQENFEIHKLLNVKTP